jgi:ribonuclease-3
VLRDADPAALSKDPKTRLQEWLQARRIAVPEYAVVATSGEAHAQMFDVECRIAALGVVTVGSGASRRAGEQAAAAAALRDIAQRGRA